MTIGLPLQDYLARHAETPASQAGTAEVIETLATVAADLSDILALGRLSGDLGLACGTGGGGDTQKMLDLRSHAMFRDALWTSPVAVFASEEAEGLEILNESGSMCLAVDPIDGSGNLDLNMPVGTIFSLLPTPDGGQIVPAPGSDVFHWPAGTQQCAAGFFVYGPQTTLALTLGDGVDMFTLDRRNGTFRLTREALRLPAAPTDEFAINLSNYRYWEEPVRSYIDECLAGAGGPFGRDFNMRWHGALVAEANRILAKGGLYAYPADARPGYRAGRLRLIYEAYPMGFLMEQAGGAASDGRRRILDLVPQTLHQRVPLFLGSRPVIEHLQRLHHRPGLWPETTAPLFANRGLFRN